MLIQFVFQLATVMSPMAPVTIGSIGATQTPTCALIASMQVKDLRPRFEGEFGLAPLGRGPGSKPGRRPGGRRPPAPPPPKGELGTYKGPGGTGPATPGAGSAAPTPGSAPVVDPCDSQAACGM